MNYRATTKDRYAWFQNELHRLNPVAKEDKKQAGKWVMDDSGVGLKGYFCSQK